MVRVYSLLSLFSLLHTSLAGSCCLTKIVQGNDDLAGAYSLYTGEANFLPTCMSVLILLISFSHLTLPLIGFQGPVRLHSCRDQYG